MKRLSSLISLVVLASLVLAACGGGGAAAYECTDALGCVTIGPEDPIHIAYWGVLSGPDGTLGEDSKRGVEVAIDDKGGKLLEHDILPMYYERYDTWRQIAKNGMRDVRFQFDSGRMAHEYYDLLYK